MEPQLVGWLSIGGLFLLLALRVPVAFAMATVGFVGYLVLAGLEPALFIAGAVPYERIANYSLTVIPLFIIMGSFMETAGLVTDIFDAAKKWVGGWPGGLVQAAIMFGAVFGGPCGSGIAGTATVGRLCIPEMERNGVQRALAFGTVAAVGPLSAMIPPSTLIILYCIIGDQPVGKLLVAGFIPGFVAAAIFIVQIYIRTKLNPSLAPPFKQKVTWKDRLISIKSIWSIALVMIVVMGGIYAGIFTPTEAGAIGAFSTFVMALVMRKFTWSNLSNVLMDTTRTIGMLFLILIGSAMFSYLLAITRIPAQVTDFIVALQVNRWLVFGAVVLMYLLLGTLIDSITQLVLTLPIILPAMLNLGFDPIWYGIVMVHLLELDMITPPFAMSIFVLQGLFPKVPVSEILRGIVPYIITDLIILLVFIFFPQIITWVPSMMK